jgi:2,3-dihydroxybiphenyl 1,2-dioxygenase
MAAVTELGYVKFGVSDLDAWRVFASEGLGLEIHPDSSSDRVFLRLDQWHHRVVLEPNNADDLLSFGLRVAGQVEFRAMQAKLDEAGIDYDLVDGADAANESVLEMLKLIDPSGNPIEIFHGPRVDAYLPFHPGRGMYGRFVTGEGGVGHMMISQRDLAATADFYRLLGMRGGIEYRVPRPDGQTAEILFMDCNSRDHTLAFGLPAKGRINHIMFEVDNLDDVFHTYERIKEHYPIAIAPGKHANDHMFSFYCVSPSGFQVEIGCSGRPATYQSEYYVRDTYGHQFQLGTSS